MFSVLSPPMTPGGGVTLAVTSPLPDVGRLTSSLYESFRLERATTRISRSANIKPVSADTVLGVQLLAVAAASAAFIALSPELADIAFDAEAGCT